MPLHIALFEPEIPPNTGNIIRLCANAGATLHLIHPMGFNISDKQCRRAGLDYREYADVLEYPSYDAFIDAMGDHRIFACTTKASQAYTEIEYAADDVFLFGPETRGLPGKVFDHLGRDKMIKIPMLPKSRSLNLSNAAAIILYEAWRQVGFWDRIQRSPS